MIAGTNGFAIITVNRTVPRDAHPTWRGHGRSRIIARGDTVLAEAQRDREPSIIDADPPMSGG